MNCAVFLPLVLFFLATTSGASECFRAPADPNDCRYLDIARTRLFVATKEFSSQYLAQGGQYDASTTSCLVSAMSYVVGCEKVSCDAYNFPVKKNLSSGWTEEQTARFVTENGSCVFSETSSAGDTTLISPEGLRVLHTTKMPEEGSHRKYMPIQKMKCLSPDARTTRDMTFSDTGTMIVDWTGRDPASIHWGKRLVSQSPGDPQITVTDGATLRLQWPDGASVDFGADGHIKASNFLASSVWDPKHCWTQKLPDRIHYAPKLDLLSDQPYVTESPDYVKR